MAIVTVQEMLDAGVHFGHRASRWNPKMKPYLLGKRNAIHIIDLKQTVRGMVRGTHFLKAVTAQGYTALFVGTKRSARNVVREEAMRCGMPFVTERWLGGTLTNFETIRRRLRRLEEIEVMEDNGETLLLKKKQLSRLMREKRKLLKNLAGIRNMTELPGALVIVDPRREHIAVREANRMNIPVVAMVDTDCDPDPIDVAIPSNDDALRSVGIVLSRLADSCDSGRKIAATRAGELERASMDERTKSALAVATGDAGRRGPAKRVVVRRATTGEGDEAATDETEVTEATADDGVTTETAAADVTASESPQTAPSDEPESAPAEQAVTPETAAAEAPTEPAAEETPETAEEAPAEGDDTEKKDS